jgi:hypothetical protein
MLELTRNGKEVYCNGKKLTMVEQATKGPGNEVIKVEGLPGSNGAKWISLKKLNEGLNQVELVAKEVTSTGSYTLTSEEKEEVDRLQARITEIKTKAKERYIPKSGFGIDPTKVTPEELEEYIAKLRKTLEAKRG